MYFFYRIFTALGMIFLAPYYAWRARKRDNDHQSYRERLGSLPASICERAKSGHGNIWVHAVSVGEVLAAKPLVEALKKSFPQRAIFVSTTTETGRRLAL